MLLWQIWEHSQIRTERTRSTRPLSDPVSFRQSIPDPLVAHHPTPPPPSVLTAEHFFELPMSRENRGFRVSAFGIVCFYLPRFIERCLFENSRRNIYARSPSPKCLQIIAGRKRPGRSAKNPAVGAKVKPTGLQLLGQTEAPEQSE